MSKSMNPPAASVSRPAVQPTTQEFSIRVPKNGRKRHNVMRFNSNLNVDISKWTQVKMERENNAREYKSYEEEMPKFGAGSEFGRDAREEARRKKFGITARKYKPENQPWILKTDGKAGKKFKGIREGGIGENAAYYVFTHAPDGAIEAFPLHEWYNFIPIQRYKTLTFEEVEDELKRRVKRMSRWSLMEKRLKKEEDDNDEDPEEGGKSKKTVKYKPDLQITEMDEWKSSDEDENESDEEGGKKKKKASDDDDDDDDKKKKKKKPITKKKKKRDSDDEAFEESDDGDEEGRECEYLTDSTDSEDEVESKEVKSVAEEDALRKALVSDEDDEEENNDDKKDDDEFDDDEAKDDKDKAKDTEKKKDKKKKKLKKKDTKKNSKDSSLSEASSDSDSDSDVPKDSKETVKKLNSAQNSRSSTPTAVASGSSDTGKRMATSSPDLSQAKRIKIETPAPYVATTPISGSNEGITEEAVRRYLMRKPMTTTELLQKFKSKKTGLSSDKLVVMMTQILKKINPTRQTIKNKMYLSLKVQPH